MITITKWGMPTQELRLEDDSAEKLLEELAEVFGVGIEWRTRTVPSADTTINL